MTHTVILMSFKTFSSINHGGPFEYFMFDLWSLDNSLSIFKRWSIITSQFESWARNLIAKYQGPA